MRRRIQLTSFSFLEIETVIDTPLWKSFNWCWRWNRARLLNPSVHQMVMVVHRPMTQSFQSENYIRVAVCCRARRSVPGIEPNLRRTVLVAPIISRLYTQLFLVRSLLASLVRCGERKKDTRSGSGHRHLQSLDSNPLTHTHIVELNELGLFQPTSR